LPFQDWWCLPAVNSYISHVHRRWCFAQWEFWHKFHQTNRKKMLLGCHLNSATPANDLFIISYINYKCQGYFLINIIIFSYKSVLF